MSAPFSEQIKKTVLYLLAGYLITYQRETKQFELSQDKNGEELNITKNDVTLQWRHISMVSLCNMMSLCNAYKAFKKLLVNIL